MRTAVNVCTFVALIAVSFWAPHAAFVPVEVRGPGFEKRVTVPAVYEDRESTESFVERMKTGNGEDKFGAMKAAPGGDDQQARREGAPTKTRVQVKAEETRVEPAKADRYVCYLGHMIHPGPAYSREALSVSGVGPVEVKVDLNRLLIEYALIIAVCALLHQFIALIPPDPEEPTRPSPWPEAPAPVAAPPAAPATAQPPAGV